MSWSVEVDQQGAVTLHTSGIETTLRPVDLIRLTDALDSVRQHNTRVGTGEPK